MIYWLINDGWLPFRESFQGIFSITLEVLRVIVSATHFPQAHSTDVPLSSMCPPEVPMFSKKCF